MDTRFDCVKNREKGYRARGRNIGKEAVSAYRICSDVAFYKSSHIGIIMILMVYKTIEMRLV